VKKEGRDKGINEGGRKVRRGRERKEKGVEGEEVEENSSGPFS
jgi:hypothetical protein